MRIHTRTVYKPLGYVGALLFLAYLIYSGRVLMHATAPLLSSIRQLEQGEKLIASNPDAASQKFSEASDTLYNTVTDLRHSSDGTKLVSVLPPFRWQIRLMKASYALAQAGTLASQLAQTAPELPQGQKDVNALITSTNSQYSQWYHQHEETIDQIQRQLAIADTEMKAVPPWIALHRYATLKHAQELVATASSGLSTAQTTITEVERLLGSEDTNQHTILVVFQNDAELRTTGGFPGSYALLQAKNGRLLGYTFGTNVFKIDKAYYAHTKIRPPDPLLTITPYLGFRDSNTQHGFLQESGAEMVDMFTKETGTRIDAMLLLDASLLEDIVRVTGPLKLPATKGTPEVTAENIRVSLTTEVEKDYFTKDANKQTNEPKQVLNDLIPVLFDKIQSTPGAFSKLLPVLSQAVQRKSLQVWFPNPEDCPTVASLLPNDQPVDKQNWIKIVNNNIGGMKSSVYVEQTVRVDQKADPLQKKLINTITITRHHAGKGIWPDGPNRNYTEVFIPKEAEIISIPQGTGGYSSLTADQNKELGISDKDWNDSEQDSSDTWKRVGFWMTTEVGGQTVKSLSYSVPLTAEFENRFTYLKQAGVTKEKVEIPSFKVNRVVISNLTLMK